MAKNGGVPTNEDARHAARRQKNGKRDPIKNHIEAKKIAGPGDLYRCLNLAEGYQQRMRRALERGRWVVLGAIWLANVVFFVAVYLFDIAARQAWSASTRNSAAFLFSTAVLTTAHYLFQYWRGQRREAELNRHAVYAIVEMVREVEPFKQSRMTAIEKTEIQVRLSQFEIGPSAEVRVNDEFEKYKRWKDSRSGVGSTLSPSQASKLPPETNEQPY